MTTTLVLLHFDEEADHFQPADAAGNLDRLGIDTGLAMPPVVDAFAGRGRDFAPASTHGLVAADAADGDTLETRDATIEVIAAIQASSVASWPRAIYIRGLDDGTAAEYPSLGLELENHTPGETPPLLELRLFWFDSGGTRREIPGGQFYAPADGYLYLVATRRWRSTTEVVVRYYVNGELLVEATTPDGDIAGSTTGHTTIGVRKSGGGFDRFFDGVIDELRVSSGEMSAEEVLATWERMTVHQPAGVDAFAALAPPGSGWGRDRSTRIGKMAKVAGTAIGLVTANAEELRANWLPDRTYADELERWERLYGLAPRALDSLDVRRQRVAAFVGRDNGYSPEQLVEVLADPLALDPADIEILEFTNTITDDFATLKSERWHAEPSAAWTIVSSALKGERLSGVDATVDGTPYRCLTSLSSGQGRIVLLAKATAWAMSGDTMGGLHLWNGVTRNGLWLGIKPNAGVDYHVGYVSRVGGVQSAFVPVLDPLAGAPVWLRIVGDPDVPGRYTFGASTTGPTSGFTEVTASNLMTDPEWGGFAVLGLDSSGAANNSITVDDAVIITPQGTRPFEWYAYRNPALPGDPDMLGANLLLRRLRPAHTHGAAITSKSVLCDDLDDGGCDRGPMGGL